MVVLRGIKRVESANTPARSTPYSYIPPKRRPHRQRLYARMPLRDFPPSHTQSIIILYPVSASWDASYRSHTVAAHRSHAHKRLRTCIQRAAGTDRYKRDALAQIGAHTMLTLPSFPASSQTRFAHARSAWLSAESSLSNFNQLLHIWIV